jgi:2-phospho-L-lactate/phosphoenolpyruvate guanylyltransferase
MWALVPLKSPETAKSRLATVLTPMQRRTLFFDLARRMIESLSETDGIECVLVITTSDEVDRFASGLGVGTIRLASDTGTANAFAEAISILRPRRLEQLLMIAGDLPLVSAHALRHLLTAADSTPVVLAPDRHHSGTNALLCTPPAAIAPCFGANSFNRHLAAARARDLQVRVVDDEALALDLDLAADLDYFQARTHKLPPLEAQYAERPFGRPEACRRPDCLLLP